MDKSKNVMASVIMSAYNAERYIAEAIASILEQTYQNFEFIIIDDASTDNTQNVIKEFQDDRIILLENHKNIGLTKSLNKGLRIARGKYIIRADADDINYPYRFERQIEFMEKNPDIMLSSCSMVTFGKDRYKMIVNTKDEEIKGRLLFQSVLPHPGFVFRRSLYLKGYRYDESYECSQDYEFQTRVSRSYKVACLPDVLVKYRLSNVQISVKKKEKQQRASRNIMKEHFEYYGLYFSESTIKDLQLICWRDFSKVSEERLLHGLWILFVIRVAFRLKRCEEKEVVCSLAKQKKKEVEKYLLTLLY